MRHTKFALLVLCTLCSFHAYDMQFDETWLDTYSSTQQIEKPEAKVQLKLNSYENPNFDRTLFARITMCFDHKGGNDALTDCAYNKFEALWRSDLNRFTQVESLTPYREAITNKILAFGVDQWQGGIKFKAAVTIIGWNGAVHFSKAEIDAVPFPNFKNATTRDEILEDDGNGSISVSFMVYCERNQYGNDCGRYCREDKNANIPYSCDPKTGAKIYQSGWESEKGEGSRCKPGIICISLSTMALVFIIGTLICIVLKYHRGSAVARSRATEPEENSHRFFQPIYMGDLTGFLRLNNTDPNTIGKPKRASSRPLSSFYRQVGACIEMERNPDDDRCLDVEADDLWPMHEDWLSNFTPSTSAQGANPVY